MQATCSCNYLDGIEGGESEVAKLFLGTENSDGHDEKKHLMFRIVLRPGATCSTPT